MACGATAMGSPFFSRHFPARTVLFVFPPGEQPLLGSRAKFAGRDTLLKEAACREFENSKRWPQIIFGIMSTAHLASLRLIAGTLCLRTFPTSGDLSFPPLSGKTAHPRWRSQREKS